MPTWTPVPWVPPVLPFRFPWCVGHDGKIRDWRSNFAHCRSSCGLRAVTRRLDTKKGGFVSPETNILWMENAPVEVGSFIPLFSGFHTFRVLRDFWTINSSTRNWMVGWVGWQSFPFGFFRPIFRGFCCYFQGGYTLVTSQWHQLPLFQ